jgi:hypothetical protein
VTDGGRGHVRCDRDCALALTADVARDCADVRAARDRVTGTRAVCLCERGSRRCVPRRDLCAAPGRDGHVRDSVRRAVCRSDFDRRWV